MTGHTKPVAAPQNIQPSFDNFAQTFKGSDPSLSESFGAKSSATPMSPPGNHMKPLRTPNKGLPPKTSYGRNT